jgi:hypothetical protein
LRSDLSYQSRFIQNIYPLQNEVAADEPCAARHKYGIREIHLLGLHHLKIGKLACSSFAARRGERFGAELLL